MVFCGRLQSRARASRTGRSVAVLACAALALSALSADAYKVRYAGVKATEGALDFQTDGYCVTADPGSHTMMPQTEAFQTLAYETYTNNKFTENAPIGGEARQAACLDTNCSWQFNHGLYLYNEWTFFWGVVYNGVDKTAAQDGVYNNFQAGVQPQAWDNVSYWGKRQPVMLSTGYWGNVDVLTYFTEWICEYYEYDKSDARFFPTYPNGDPIVPDSSSGSTYVHCGKRVEYTSKGYWVDQRCKDPFPWWAAMLIAVCATVVVIAIIIIIACCCCSCRRSAEEDVRERKLRTIGDNPAQIPNQTDVGLSRQSFRGGDDDDDEEEEYDD